MKSRVKKNKNYMDFAAWTVLICINYSQKWMKYCELSVRVEWKTEEILKSSSIVIAWHAFQNIKLQQHKNV